MQIGPGLRCHLGSFASVLPFLTSFPCAFAECQVDDSRATLAYAVRELQADVVEEEAALAAVGAPVPETHLGVYVIHNKLVGGERGWVEQVGGGRAGGCGTQDEVMPLLELRRAQGA